MKWLIRPLENGWTDPETKSRRPSGVFRATWNQTLKELAEEIDKIGGKDPVVVQVDVAETDIRLDGMLRANVKAGHPGVVISFDSKFGPLRYATDAYEPAYFGDMEGWQANLRAVMLTLRALRDLDRWGVSKRGEQYTGWKALPSGGDVTFPSADEALRWMTEMAAGFGFSDRDPSRLYRYLARRWHTDSSDEYSQDWERLMAAKLLLRTARML